MSLKIVTGGTTDAADGTLVSSGNKFVFTAIDGVVNLHLRCDDDTWSADSTISLPSDGSVQISFDGGSTWKGFADSPTNVVTGIGIGGLDVGDLNFPIKLRQHAATATTSGQITSDGTFSACTALSNVGSFAASVASPTSVSVSWAAVTNRTRYQVDRATNSGFTTGVTLGVYTGTGTSFTDSGLTAGTTYYYRIKAVGTYRYSDSASFATANATPDWTSPAVISIAADSDDALRRLTGSAFVLAGGPGIGAGRYDGSFKRYGCGMRFANVQIPAGATISTATFAGKVYGNDPGTDAKTRIRAQKVSGNNPGTFTDQTDFDSRILTAGAVDSSKITTAVVAWDEPTPWVTDAAKTSPEIKTIIQEIVNYAGWAAGNAIVLFWDDFDDRSTGTDSLRFLYDHEQGNQPVLSITFTP